MADDVQVVNRRLDASENEALIGMARMGADAFGYTADVRAKPDHCREIRPPAHHPPWDDAGAEV